MVISSTEQCKIVQSRWRSPRFLKEMRLMSSRDDVQLPENSFCCKRPRTIEWERWPRPSGFPNICLGGQVTHGQSPYVYFHITWRWHAVLNLQSPKSSVIWGSIIHTRRYWCNVRTFWNRLCKMIRMSVSPHATSLSSCQDLLMVQFSISGESCSAYQIQAPP